MFENQRYPYMSNYNYNKIYHYNPTYTPYPKDIYNVENKNVEKSFDEENEPDLLGISTENKTDEINEIKSKGTNNKDDEEKKQRYFGPIGLDKDRLSIFGFSINIDDLIIVGLILFLFLQDSADYLLIIVLLLMLLDINLSSFTQSQFLRKLIF